MEKLVIAHGSGACAEIIACSITPEAVRSLGWKGMEGDGLVRITACTHQLQIGEV